MGAVAALLGDSAVAHGDISAAARFYTRALKYRNWKDYAPAKQDQFGAHSNSFARAEWPPRCFPPSPPMPPFNPVFIAWSLTPKRSELLENYAKFLKAHPDSADASGALKNISDLLSGHEKLVIESKTRREQYDLALEENAIENLLDTEPQVALKKLRAVVEQRRSRSHEKTELLSSLTGLGKQLNLLGFTQEAIAPLAEALSLSKTMMTIRNSSNDDGPRGIPGYLPNPRLPEIDPEVAMAQVKMESGNFSDAENLLSDAIRICDDDESVKFDSIKYRFLLIDCLLAAHKIEASQGLLAETRKKCNEQKWSGWNAKLSMAELAIAAENYSKTLSAETKQQVVEQTKAEEFDSVAKVRNIATADILLGKHAVIEKSFTEAKSYFDDAELQLRRLPLQPKTLAASLAEGRAKMYVAGGNLELAKQEYRRAIDYLSKAISPNCKRVAALTVEYSKLSAD